MTHCWKISVGMFFAGDKLVRNKLKSAMAEIYLVINGLIHNLRVINLVR